MLFRPRLLSSSSRMKSLSEFLLTNRGHYLEALKVNKAQDWTVVIGNEAGDLDTTACSIAYSYLSSTLLQRPTIALLRTARSDFHLRAENDYAFSLAKMKNDHSDLLCIDDIPPEHFCQLLRSSFTLVDHNRLDRMFNPTPNTDPRVVAIIDHHADEGYHTDASCRTIVVPVGSCASLVTEHFSDRWLQTVGQESPQIVPGLSDVAALLLSAILIDTNGLKKNGKAVELDYKSAEFLLHKSSLKKDSSSIPNAASVEEKYGEISRNLEELKSSVSHLSSRDLLRRDYKEYSITQTRTKLNKTLGIASVPLSFKAWLKVHPSPEFWDALDKWMKERNLDILSILFSFRSEKKNKHKRQTLWLVRSDVPGSRELRTGLFKRLEESQELELEARKLKKAFVEGVEVFPPGEVKTRAGGIARVWKQLKVDATRKTVAPLAKSIIEAL